MGASNGTGGGGGGSYSSGNPNHYSSSGSNIVYSSNSNNTVRVNSRGETPAEARARKQAEAEEKEFQRLYEEAEAAKVAAAQQAEADAKLAQKELDAKNAAEAKLAQEAEAQKKIDDANAAKLLADQKDKSKNLNNNIIESGENGTVPFEVTGPTPEELLLAAQKEASTAVTNSASDIDPENPDVEPELDRPREKDQKDIDDTLLEPEIEESLTKDEIIGIVDKGVALQELAAENQSLIPPKVEMNTPIETESGGMTSGGAAGNPVIEPPEDTTPVTDTGGGGGGGVAGAPPAKRGGNFWSQGMPTVEETADKDPKKKGKGRRRRALRLGAKSLAIPTVGSGGSGKSVGS